jgi:hypothetical protein
VDEVGKQTTYTLTGLTEGRTYAIAVTALDTSSTGNESGKSNTITVSVPRTQSEVAATPVGTSATIAVLAKVAAYSFNEGSGSTVTDASRYKNTGTISGARWTSAGKFGRALVFNGTSAKVTIPEALSLRLTTDMALAAWGEAVEGHKYVARCRRQRG